MADYTGKYIGRYLIREQPGEGGMAVVFRAFDTNLECDVAVKFVRTDQIIPAQLDQMLKCFEHFLPKISRICSSTFTTSPLYTFFCRLPFFINFHGLGPCFRTLMADFRG
ncbi:MAG: hypothetical protein JEZ06_11225 [Anaerolineaceae bacterium]|nr:hypothetical protein [Anaerolineaceae bacterium]